jgi:hypothetical protein
VKTDTKVRAIACRGCGAGFKSGDDLYHLILPSTWTIDDVRAWGDEGATISWLHNRGVRVDRICVGCQTKE